MHLCLYACTRACMRMPACTRTQHHTHSAHLRAWPGTPAPPRHAHLQNQTKCAHLASRRWQTPPTACPLPHGLVPCPLYHSSSPHHPRQPPPLPLPSPLSPTPHLARPVLLTPSLAQPYWLTEIKQQALHLLRRSCRPPPSPPPPPPGWKGHGLLGWQPTLQRATLCSHAAPGVAGALLLRQELRRWPLVVRSAWNREFGPPFFAVPAAPS